MKFVLSARQKPSYILLLIIGFIAIVATFNTIRHENGLAEDALDLPNIQVTQSKQVNTYPDGNWQEITTQVGDSLASIFSKMGLSQKTLQIILDNNPYKKHLTQIQPNRTIKFLIEGTVLKTLIMPLSKTELIKVVQTDDTYKTTVETMTSHIKIEQKHATVQHSLYLTAQKAQIPFGLIQQMTEILAWQMNFSRDVRDGDQFTIQYEAHYINQEKIKNGRILAVYYQTPKKTYQAIQYQNHAGKIDYYTPEGQSLRKAFNRYPLQFSHISSSFNPSRMHPILKERRPHKGIDLAAPIGTPIRATSDGRIVSIGYENGFGNKIKIQHSGPYTSIYAHLLKFKKGLKRGDKVEKGEVIGYVGQTGLATAPHCHYEFHIHNKPQNPSTVQLPAANPVPASELAQFKLKANTIVASLNAFSKPFNEPKQSA